MVAVLESVEDEQAAEVLGELEEWLVSKLGRERQA